MREQQKICDTGCKGEEKGRKDETRISKTSSKDIRAPKPSSEEEAKVQRLK